MREKPVLFMGILKWSLLAICIGALVGASTALFLTLLNRGVAWVSPAPLYFVALPLVLAASALIVRWLAPEAEGHGTEKVIEAIHQRSGRIDPRVVPVKLVATLVTLIGGGSAGKEGPCAQIGAGISSFFSDALKLDDEERKTLVICGMSAGFASVFGTPLAGAIFGVEVLFAGSILYDVLLPSIVAGIVGFHVTSALGITYMASSLSRAFTFSGAFFATVVVAGIFFGLCSWLLIESLALGKRLSSRIDAPRPVKGLMGGSVLVIATFALSGRYLGLGTDTIVSRLGGQSGPWYEFVAKALFTSVTLNFGGSGGIVTPIFFIGATSGAAFASALGLDVATFASIGMVALLAGSANTPIAASVMAIELFGAGIAHYAALACIISFFMTGNYSVYPSQVLRFRKSASLDVATAGERPKGRT